MGWIENTPTGSDSRRDLERKRAIASSKEDAYRTRFPPSLQVRQGTPGRGSLGYPWNAVSSGLLRLRFDRGLRCRFGGCGLYHRHLDRYRLRGSLFRGQFPRLFHDAPYGVGKLRAVALPIINSRSFPLHECHVPQGGVPKGTLTECASYPLNRVIH